MHPDHPPRPVPGPDSAVPGPGAWGDVAAGSAEPLSAVAAALAGLDGRPVVEHIAVYDQVHRLLQDALASLDER